MKHHNYIFDLDGTVVEAVSYNADAYLQMVSNEFGSDFLNSLTIDACGYPHLVFPGFYSLFRWLHSRGGNIHFFSSGAEERNLELVPKLIKMAFKEKADELIPNVKIFSRHHCVDTNLLPEQEKEKYQTIFYGQRKKKLEHIVVSTQELPWTLLIEDDSSYIVPGEEANLIKVASHYTWWSKGSYGNQFFSFHKAFYLCGLIKKIHSVSGSENITLAEAAKHVQVDQENGKLGRNFYYPSVIKMEYYLDGMVTLQNLDPTLKLYFEPNPED